MKTQSICLALAIALLCTTGSAQWVQTNGPYGGTVTCFVVSGTSLFAGTTDGIYLSTDNGELWTPVNIGSLNTRINALAVNGNIVFAGVGRGWWDGGWEGVVGEWGVVRSTDNGTSWTAANMGLPPDTAVLSLAVNGTNLFAGTYDGGVYLSTDNGARWQAAGVGLPYDGSHVAILDLAVVGTSIFAVTQGFGVFRSTNSGTSWNLVGCCYCTPNRLGVSNGHLFLGGNCGVFRSTDNGENWSVTTPESDVIGFGGGLRGGFAVRETSIFAAGEGGVFLSSNDGASWTPVNNGLTNTVVNTIVVSSSILFAGTEGGGVFRSSDNGTSWSAASRGLGRTSVNAFAMNIDETGDEILIAVGSMQGGVFVSTNGGGSWSPASGGMASFVVNSLAFRGTNLFAGTGHGVYLSTNRGTGWTAVNEGLPKQTMWDTTQYVSITCFAWSGQTLFAGSGGFLQGGGVFCSTNNGTNWTSVGKYAPPPRSLAVDTCGTPPTRNLFLGGFYNGVYRLSENDTAWTACGLLDTAAALQAGALALIPEAGGGTRIYAGTSDHWAGGFDMSFPVKGKGVFLSTDNGGSWSGVNTGLTNLSIHSFATCGTSLFAGTDGGIFLTTDGGTGWTAVNSGLPDIPVYVLAASARNLYAGTEYGVWRRPLSDLITSVTVSSGSNPTVFSLAQNYPNPFNSATKIRFTIANTRLPHEAQHGGQGQLTIVKVCDVLGREVATLVNEVKEPGTYTLQFDASNLSSGVYFCRLTAGDYVMTKRMLVLK